MPILNSFEEWKEHLGELLKQSKKEELERITTELGNYLQANEDPCNDQERLLTDLWKESSVEEQHMIAKFVVRLVK
ncbi:DUF3243 family protein [Halalkalibacter akibai]|uniref:DUF3243 domain-containing protein n=1 Tax=Halalkalibacter akibai (strain ATCC 43226 / DSM 21942 / CIP 109018 / JCM 9157 / 1139) TaxID=1236973 RepID=W4QUY1_HALA3|nr:DUF3243 family protein [Halalkalibacter akibai]GAE35144.1 hypothetical protein JCM9157_2239 [Halalkalibacter akibai JCM 9157]